MAHLAPTPLQVMGAEGHESALLRKVAAGMLSGALAAGICNPTDLVKTRMQVLPGSLRYFLWFARLAWSRGGCR